ncbi:MAG: glycoside hydrolase family 3 N-terminal domain-containing protein [Candidatus Paceibacterota bacterium]
MDWEKATLLIVALVGVIWLLVIIFSPGLVKVPDLKPTSSARLTLNRLSYEEKIGQRFIIGFQGTSVTPELENKIKELHPGGVLLLGRNLKDGDQLERLTDNLQEIALEDTGLPLFISVDQEGEPLCRINWLECTSPSAIESEEQALEIGLERGKRLKELGVNLNLAPVLDKSYPGDFVYPRTFQSRDAGFLAKSFISGQQKHVFSVLKHFPGYTTIDFDPEREKLAKLDFIPDIDQFKIAMKADPVMVMTSNVVYNELSDYPLTMSPEGIDFVREELNPGLIISENLLSPVMKENYGLEDTVVETAEAGVDILLVAGFNEIKDTRKAIEALEKKKIDNQQFNESLLKIIKLKQKINEKNY